MISLVMIIGVFSLFISSRDNIGSIYLLDSEIHLYDYDGKKIIEVESEKDEIQLWGDFIFNSSENKEGTLILLKNFKPCPFSLNGSEYFERHNIEIPSSKENLYSTDNCIEIKGLDLNKNDMCLILTIDNIIVTKRFQVINVSSDKKNNVKSGNCFFVNQTLERKVQYMKDRMTLVDSENEQFFLNEVIEKGTLCCAININKCFEGLQLQNEFENCNRNEISYAIVPIAYSYSGEVEFWEPFSVKTDYEAFGFEARINSISDVYGIRFLIFPFANEYDDNFLKTFKAFLWSNPITTYTIFKEEK